MMMHMFKGGGGGGGGFAPVILVDLTFIDGIFADTADLIPELSLLVNIPDFNGALDNTGETLFITQRKI